MILEEDGNGSQIIATYRVRLVVANLGWVGYDFGHSTTTIIILLG